MNPVDPFARRTALASHRRQVRSRGPFLALFLALSAALAAVGAPTAPGPDLQVLQERWAEARYQLEGEARLAALEDLAEAARDAVGETPDSAELLIWEGIILASYAGEKGGLGALGLVKEARTCLERALELDPDALDGSAYTSLGSLYYQVPGFPLGFGSDRKAREFLTRALELNPDGIDPNYFWGDFLLEEGEYEAAAAALRHALEAPSRPGRALADEGRRQEIRTALAKAEEKLARRR